MSRVVASGPAGRIKALAQRWLELAPVLAETVRSALKTAAARVVARQPCLRDARPQHFLFEGDRVTGLVDFGAMGEDSIACDLARLGSEWLGDDRVLRAEALDAYGTVRPLGETELELIPVFEESAALLIGAHWVRWQFLEGRSFEDPLAVSTGLEKGLDRVLARLCPDGTLLPEESGKD
jgi:homoserine kinase type II